MQKRSLSGGKTLFNLMLLKEEASNFLLWDFKNEIL